MPNGVNFQDGMWKEKAKEQMDLYYKTKDLKYKEKAKDYERNISKSNDEDEESRYSGDDSGWGFEY